MHTPVEITFRSMIPIPAAEQSIHRWVHHLARRCGRLQRCVVVIERSHRNTFHVHVSLTVREHTIADPRDPCLEQGHPDLQIAISDAFCIARRQLRDHARVVGDAERR
jgi:hypothetical protein